MWKGTQLKRPPAQHWAFNDIGFQVKAELSTKVQSVSYAHCKLHAVVAKVSFCRTKQSHPSSEALGNFHIQIHVCKHFLLEKLKGKVFSLSRK